MRFTLPKLFLAVAMAALACAGLLTPNHWWANSILSLTICLYAVVAIGAVRLRGREQAFAITFALVGGAYLLLAMCSVFQFIGKSLVTNYPLALIANAQHQFSIPASQGYYAPTAVYSAAPGSPPYVVPPPVSPTTTANGTLTLSTVTVDSQIPLESIISAAWIDYGNQGYQKSIGSLFRIGHCVWSWLFALLAGWFAGAMYAKRARVPVA